MNAWSLFLDLSKWFGIKKSPLRGAGRKVGSSDSVPDRGAPNSPSYRFTRRALVFRYYLLNIAGEAETATHNLMS